MFDKYISITSWSSKTMLHAKHNIWIILTKKQYILFLLLIFM